MVEHFDGHVHFVGVSAVHDYGSKFTHSSEDKLFISGGVVGIFA